MYNSKIQWISEKKILDIVLPDSRTVGELGFVYFPLHFQINQ